MSKTIYDVGGVLLPRPFHAQRLGHVGLTQQDLEGATDFFVNDLGFRKSDLIPGPDGRPVAWFTTFGSDHHSLVHVDARLEAQNPDLGRGVTVNQISFQVGTLKEVADASVYFADNGIKTWRYGRDFPGSNWAVYAYDPDGYRVELFYGMEQVGWDRRSKPAVYYNPGYVPALPEPAEISEIASTEAIHPDLAPGYRADEQDMPFEHEVGGIMLARPFAINKVGPIHLFVEDVGVSEDFYCHHLGLVKTETVDWQGHKASFLRHGTDHHSVGLFPVALREALGLDVRTRMMALGVELGSYRQLTDAVAWLRGRGHTVVTDMPRALRPGIDHAAFVTDPNGHLAMLYCGIEQIGWDGRSRPVAERRDVEDAWPLTLEPASDTYQSLTRQGPMA